MVETPSPAPEQQGAAPAVTDSEVDYGRYWFWVFIGVALVGVGIVVDALTVHPAETAGLVALVIAATVLPFLTLWAAKISSAELVQSTARSARARNELIGLSIAGLTSDIRASAELETKAVVGAIEALRAVTEKGSADVTKEVKNLAETISRVGAAQVQALKEAKEASEQQAEATRALEQLQLRAEERARPQLHAQTQVRSHWLFFHHNWLVLGNTGGRARGVTAEFRFLQQNNWVRVQVPGFELDTQQQREFDIGDVNATGGSNRVWISIRYRDDADRQHLASIDLPLGGNQWVQMASRPVE